ncbi:MAG: glycosyltransferase [Candidatus Binatia bacterium]
MDTNFPLTTGSGSRTGHAENRPKLLFLAWAFPPANASSSSVRTWNTAKYLARLGWDVTVVTPNPFMLRHVERAENVATELKREGIRRILTDHHWRCLSADHLKCWNRGIGRLIGGVVRQVAWRLRIEQAIGWVKAAEQACSRLAREDVEIILASGPPFAAFRLARRLSDKLRRPYVLDYRDLWTDWYPSASTAQQEARLLEGCAAVTTVSRSCGLAIYRRFGCGAKLHVVTNGYDPEEFAYVKPYAFGHFAIVYAGAFDPPKRVISPVTALLKRLKETTSGNGKEWYFHYYGPHNDYVSAEAARAEVMDRVVVHGRVSRIEALSAVKGAGAALVITSIAEEPTLVDKGIVTGKVFEALGFGIPVLAVAPRGSDLESIAETTGLVESFTARDTEGMASFLRDLMLGETLELKNGQVYAWPNIAKKLDVVLRKAMSSGFY